MSFVACEIDEKWEKGVSKYYINKWLFNWEDGNFNCQKQRRMNSCKQKITIYKNNKGIFMNYSKL